MGSVTLYETKRRIWLTMEDDGVHTTRNMAMHNPDFIAFKDSQTQIEFVIRNTDRKPINLEGRQLFITLVDHQSGRTMASFDLPVVDASRGLCRLLLEPVMVKDLNVGILRYTVSYRTASGSDRILPTDRYETGHGFMELTWGRELQGVAPQVISWEEFQEFNVGRQDDYWLSPIVKGSIQHGSLDGLHTCAIYASNFTGSIWIEASIRDGSPTENDWFPIIVDGEYDIRLTNFSGISPHNIEANLVWLRFKVKPEGRNGKGIDKIVFRN